MATAINMANYRKLSAAITDAVSEHIERAGGLVDMPTVTMLATLFVEKATGFCRLAGMPRSMFMTICTKLSELVPEKAGPMWKPDYPEEG